MLSNNLMEGLTFDDVLLMPAYSELLPSDVDLSTHLTQSLVLNRPFLSAAMDTVTEARTAITMAREGGVGIIHKNMSIEAQAREVSRVKKSESGMIVSPVTIGPSKSIKEALDIMEMYHISGVPVTVRRKLVGILTNRDLRFETNLSRKVNELMTSENLITVDETVGLEDAKVLLHKHRIEKLPVVDAKGNLVGLITTKDIEKAVQYPDAAKDGHGRLLAGAAIGVGGDRAERVAELVANDVDVICIDSAHGNSKNVVMAVEKTKAEHPHLQVVAGNIATGDAAQRLIDAGADAVKVGIGPGSICTTRIVAGVGMPQITAIHEVSKVAGQYKIPVIADGGVKYSGDIVKALAAGADCVMIGSMFAGTDESPGEVIIYQGRSYKMYRGMGSQGAMLAGSGDRYNQGSVTEARKLVPEGIEGRVPYKGSLSDMIFQMIGGLRSGMGYTGCATIAELKANARFVRITSSGLRESHVHDVVITKEAPNYRME